MYMVVLLCIGLYCCVYNCIVVYIYVSLYYMCLGRLYVSYHEVYGNLAPAWNGEEA